MTAAQFETLETSEADAVRLWRFEELVAPDTRMRTQWSLLSTSTSTCTLQRISYVVDVRAAQPCRSCSSRVIHRVGGGAAS